MPSKKWEESHARSRADNQIYSRMKTVKKKLIKERGKKCQQCGRMPAAIDAHHLVKIRHGGSNDGSNILLLCEGCHMLEHVIRVRR
jgi:5-methylcytosine-specific restriction protein A